ncbi:hypothetical protein F3129_14115 [Bacillus velezensis]|nr:hypothetical protein D3C60_14020 [Bacillus velezensis]EYB36679.1 hypothetical protein AW26_0106900 [Bacillus amyloliquefaciens EBL11]POR12648.1 hypothetical protein B9W23_16775 [Bacillus velezensis]QCE19361.1 hypothetical protein SB21_13740 [Bacillus velezensis]QEV92517.1 hypothetical protein F3129_14115 [Bacillus velezensis]
MYLCLLILNKRFGDALLSENRFEMKRGCRGDQRANVRQNYAKWTAEKNGSGNVNLLLIFLIELMKK